MTHPRYFHLWPEARRYALGHDVPGNPRQMVGDMLNEVDRLYGRMEEMHSTPRVMAPIEPVLVRAAEAERAAIVKWLRAKRVVVGGVAVETEVDLDEVADAIERGEHLK